MTHEDALQSYAENVIAEQGYDSYMNRMMKQEADFWNQINAAANPEKVAQICETHPYNNLETTDLF